MNMEESKAAGGRLMKKAPRPRSEKRESGSSSSQNLFSGDLWGPKVFKRYFHLLQKVKDHRIIELEEETMQYHAKSSRRGEKKAGKKEKEPKAVFDLPKDSDSEGEINDDEDYRDDEGKGEDEDEEDEDEDERDDDD